MAPRRPLKRQTSSIERHTRLLSQSFTRARPKPTTNAVTVDDAMVIDTGNQASSLHRGTTPPVQATQLTEGTAETVRSPPKATSETWRRDRKLMGDWKKLAKNIAAVLKGAPPEELAAMATATLKVTTDFAAYGGVTPSELGSIGPRFDAEYRPRGSSGRKSREPMASPPQPKQKQRDQDQEQEHGGEWLSDAEASQADMDEDEAESAAGQDTQRRTLTHTSPAKRAGIPFVEFAFDIQNSHEDIKTLRENFIETCNSTQVEIIKDNKRQMTYIHEESVKAMADVLFGQIMGPRAIQQCQKVVQQLTDTDQENFSRLTAQKAKKLSEDQDEPETLRPVYRVIERIHQVSPQVRVVPDFESVCAWLELRDLFLQIAQRIDDKDQEIIDRMNKVVYGRRRGYGATTRLFDFLCHKDVLHIDRRVFDMMLTKGKFVDAFVRKLGRGVLVVLTNSIIMLCKAIGLQASRAMIDVFVVQFPDVVKAFDVLERGCYDRLIDARRHSQLPSTDAFKFSRKDLYLDRLVHIFGVSAQAIESLQGGEGRGHDAADAISIADTDLDDNVSLESENGMQEEDYEDEDEGEHYSEHSIANDEEESEASIGTEDYDDDDGDGDGDGDDDDDYKEDGEYDGEGEDEEDGEEDNEDDEDDEDDESDEGETSAEEAESVVDEKDGFSKVRTSQGKQSGTARRRPDFRARHVAFKVEEDDEY